MQGKIKRSAQLKIYVGIDVSKAWLDVAITPTNTVFRVANTMKGYWRRWTFRNHRLSRELGMGQSTP